MTTLPESEHDLASAMVQQQARLIRLCASLSGDETVAEDLAAEVLLEAWRNRHKLYDLTGLPQWLSAIARHVCLRWLRKNGADNTRLMPLYEDEHDDPHAHWLCSGDELEQEFERHELAELLDHALTRLPPDTRNILIEQQIYQRPHAEIAARMGISAAAVTMRLSRGKAQLRKLFATELYENVADYDFFNPAQAGWETTPLWCHECGCRRLEGRYERPDGILSFRCPTCNPEPTVNQADIPLMNAQFGQLLRDVWRYRIAWNRIEDWTHTYFRQGIANKIVNCTHCGHPNTLHQRMPDQAAPSVRKQHGLHVCCDACGETCSVSRTGLVMAHPTVRQFHQNHPRMRTLPEKEITVDGRAAFVTAFQSFTHHATLEIISAVDDFEVMRIHAAPSFQVHSAC